MHCHALNNARSKRSKQYALICTAFKNKFNTTSERGKRHLGKATLFKLKLHLPIFSHLLLLHLGLEVVDAQLHVALEAVLLVQLLLHGLALGELLLQPRPELRAQLLDAALVTRLRRKRKLLSFSKFIIDR